MVGWLFGKIPSICKHDTTPIGFSHSVHIYMCVIKASGYRRNVLFRRQLSRQLFATKSTYLLWSENIHNNLHPLAQLNVLPTDWRLLCNIFYVLSHRWWNYSWPSSNNCSYTSRVLFLECSLYCYPAKHTPCTKPIRGDLHIGERVTQKIISLHRICCSCYKFSHHSRSLAAFTTSAFQQAYVSI